MWAPLHGFCDGIAAPDAAEYATHVARLQTAMAEHDLSAVVVEPSPTMTWLSGVRWGRSERPFLLVVPQQGEPWFVAPAFEEGTARQRLGDATLHTWQEHDSPFALLAKHLPRGSGRVGVDGEMRTFIVAGLRAAMKRPVVDGRAAIDAVRMSKSDAELSRLRRANEATKAALALVANVVEPGMPQSEVAALARAAQQAAGLADVWVLALAGEAAAYPHGTEHDRVLGSNELLLVDTGGALHGYRSDITRTWAVGTPTDAAARAWETVAAAQRAGLAVMKPGVTAGAVDAAARAVIESGGYGGGYDALTHRLGHGIGLQVHEPPYLVPHDARALTPGMTMSNEPGIYKRGEFGVRIEDIVAITPSGHEVFGPLVGSLDAPFGG